MVTTPVIFCFEDQDVEEAARIMQENQIRRLVILNRDKCLAGGVSLGDLAMKRPADQSGEVLQSVSDPDGTR
jgi:predicted transcriptional regulator